MPRSLLVFGFLMLLADSPAVAAPPPEAQVQGLYEGKVKDGQDELKLEARVVAQGKGTYKVLIRQMLKDNKIAHVELTGKTTGDAVTVTDHKANGWSARYAAGSFKGTFGPGDTAWEVKRVEKKPPSLGKKPPVGAITLLDGKNLLEMVRANGLPWLGDMSHQIDKDGSLQVPKGGMNSKREFEGSFDLHVEFFLPLMPTDHGQGRSNSGVYLPCGQEIQVLDSFGETTYKGGGCGGFYAFQDPDTMDVIESLKGQAECKYSLASLPPLEWQTYDVEYRVDKKDGKYVGHPHVTVYHNGTKIHDKFTLPQDAHKGHFHFQDHGNPVRFRNIWVLPVEQN